ncbi:hypothetical protein NM688_g8926 [Phlebia brevispora]|uniref:Uncharacterized protein n=1 Tax=Phlebia brevispora TaxID=194682 RepID=A0ACC1RQS2_9APHY|nr:hypothetical protein NM688_g8926 [Phlebia brevispora]
MRLPELDHSVTSKAAKAATRQKTRKTRSSTSRQSSSPSSYPGSPLRIVTKETRSTRNRTLRSPQGDLSSSLPGSKPQRWACPYHDCVMEFSRKKDCERHQNGHKGKQFFCAGLPVVGEAGELLEESEEWTRWEGLDGMLFVGGCGKAFSRKDAYTRHLRESCLGDPAGHWWEDPRIKRFLASLSS